MLFMEISNPIGQMNIYEISKMIKFNIYLFIAYLTFIFQGSMIFYIILTTPQIPIVLRFCAGLYIIPIVALSILYIKWKHPLHDP